MSTNSDNIRQTPSVPSVQRALSMLELIVDARRGLSLSELCRKLGLPKSSAHCLVLTLERHGYVLRNPATNRYVVGTKLFSMGESALNGIPIREKASPFLQVLMKKTGLTVHLAILDHGYAVIIDKVPAPGLLQLATWVGKRFDLHCSGVGKALLAYLPEEEFLAVVRTHGLPRYNENTLISAKRLAVEIESIKRLGYALEDEEGEIGYRCIGAPIFNSSGVVIAAASVAGTTSQITDGNLRVCSRQLLEATQQISLTLGYSSRLLKT